LEPQLTRSTWHEHVARRNWHFNLWSGLFFPV